MGAHPCLRIDRGSVRPRAEGRRSPSPSLDLRVKRRGAAPAAGSARPPRPRSPRWLRIMSIRGARGQCCRTHPADARHHVRLHRAQAAPGHHAARLDTEASSRCRMRQGTSTNSPAGSRPRAGGAARVSCSRRMSKMSCPSKLGLELSAMGASLFSSHFIPLRMVPQEFHN